MKKKSLPMLIGAFLLATSGAANALLIDPSDDGSIYSNGNVSASTYLMASGSIQAAAEFSLNGMGSRIYSALLSVNPYGLPLWDKTVDIYGYSSDDGILTSADYDAGLLLGTLTLRDDLGNGEESFFDVTDFINSISSRYAGFSLRTDSKNVFSSLEYNYGKPAQLVVENIPEPSSLALMLFGIWGIISVRNKKAH